MKSISERAAEICLEKHAAPFRCISEWLAIGCLADALDEWQRATEERLVNFERALLEQSDAELIAVRASIRRGARVTDHRFQINRPAPTRFEEEKPPTPRACGYEADPVETEE